MRTFNHIFRLLAVIPLILVCCSFSCNDEPVGPREPKEYPFYISNIYPREIQVYHPLTNKIDSISIPWYSYAGVTVSADGQLLYIAQGTSVVVLETDSFSLVTELMYLHEHAVAVSADNKFISIAGDDVNLLRTSDYSPVFNDTAASGQGVFSPDSKTFYYLTSQVSPDTGYLVHKVNLADGLFTVTTKPLAGRGLIQFLPSVDETKWFLYSNVALWTSAFQVYDVAKDTIIFSQLVRPGSGTIAISPDGKLAFYTNPGNNAIVFPPPDFSFTIFDVYANSVDTVIKAPEYFSDTDWGGPPNLLSVSPDSRMLGILGGNLANIAFYVFDIEKRELVFRAIPDSQVSAFVNISSQSMR